MKNLAESVKKQEKEITQRKTVQVARKQGKKSSKSTPNSNGKQMAKLYQILIKDKNSKSKSNKNTPENDHEIVIK